MGRVINLNTPGKLRNQHRRTIAEMLRHLSQQTTLSTESKDMIATIIFSLAEINDSIKTSISAWEKKGYWMKAERFQEDWIWSRSLAADLDDIVRHEAWDLLPQLIIQLFPHFADIKIKSFTRKPDIWTGAYERLLKTDPIQPPY